MTSDIERRTAECRRSVLKTAKVRPSVEQARKKEVRVDCFKRFFKEVVMFLFNIFIIIFIFIIFIVVFCFC